MDYVEFLYPRTNKMIIYFILIVIFVVRWSDNINTLNYECTGEAPFERCGYTGELKRHVGFPLETYRIYVTGAIHYNYFYDFNFAANLGIWYIAACILNFLLETATAKKVEKKIVKKIHEHRR